MTKKELIACIPDAKEMGLRVAPDVLLDIFEDDEEVPEYMVRLFLSVPEEPRDITILIGDKMAQEMDKAISEWIKNNPEGEQ